MTVEWGWNTNKRLYQAAQVEVLQSAHPSRPYAWRQHAWEPSAPDDQEWSTPPKRRWPLSPTDVHSSVAKQSGAASSSGVQPCQVPPAEASLGADMLEVATQTVGLVLKAPPPLPPSQQLKSGDTSFGLACKAPPPYSAGQQCLSSDRVLHLMTKAPPPYLEQRMQLQSCSWTRCKMFLLKPPSP